MNIEVKSSYYGTEIIFEAENVRVEESISSTEYAIKEDGKRDFSKRLGDDIDNEWMDKFATIMEDITYYRKKDYDSTALIETLFEKLPDGIKKSLSQKLLDEYMDL